MINAQEAQVTHYTAEQLNTLSAVADALVQIGLMEVQRAAIVSVSKIDKSGFMKALLSVLNKDKDAGKSIGVVKLYLYLCTKSVTDALTKMNIPIRYDELVKRGIENGVQFRSQINAALTSKNPVAIQELQEALYGKVTPLRIQEAGQEQSEVPASESANERYSGDVDTSTGEIQSYEGNENTSVEREYRSVHVYGKSHALCFSASKTKTGQIPTINVDAAQSSGERQYDWKKAVHFQFTAKEMFGLGAVLVGDVDMAEFKSHGAANDKGFSLERQEKNFYAKLFSKEGGQRAVPIPFNDMMPLAILIFDQLESANPSYTKPTLAQIIHMVYGIKPKSKAN